MASTQKNKARVEVVIQATPTTAAPTSIQKSTKEISRAAVDARSKGKAVQLPKQKVNFSLKPYLGQIVLYLYFLWDF